MPIHKGLHGAKFILSLVIIVLFAYVMVYADKFFKPDEVVVVNSIFTEESRNDLASIDVNTAIVASSDEENIWVIQYIVQPWDTLGGIARQFGTTIGHLKKINNIWNSPIRWWQKLIVTDQEDGFVYTIKDKVAIWVFADTYGLNKEDLMSLNYIQDETEMLQPGQELFINLTTEQAYQANLMERPKPRPVVVKKPTITRSQSTTRVTTTTLRNPSSSSPSNSASSSNDSDIISQWTYREKVNNGFYAWYCTWYAAIITPEIFGPVKDGKQDRPFGGDAKQWYANAKAAWFSVGKTPRVWSLVVYNPLRSSAWHVGKVIKYLPEEGKIVVRDMNYIGKFIVTERRDSTDNSKIIWYIYP